jgi:tetratricopeptide (TPR) repeat protein
MRHALAIALLAVGLGTVGILGCKTNPKTGKDGQIARPTGVDNYVRAMKTYNAGDRDRALSQLMEATRVNPDLIMARLVLGDLFRAQGDYKKAVEQYEKLTKLDPNYAPNWYRLGVGYQFIEKLKEAASSYRKAIAIEPKDDKSNMNLGLVELYLGHPEEAVKYSTKATELAPKNAAAWSNLGVALDANKDYPKAEEAYRKAIDLDPKNATTLMNLASNLMSQNKPAEAVEIMNSAVKLSKTPATLKRYGDTLAKAGRYDDAVAQYQAALDLDPKFFPAMNEIGFTRIADYRKNFELDEEKREQAVAMWKQSLDIKPDQPRVAEALKQWGQNTQSVLSK